MGVEVLDSGRTLPYPLVGVIIALETITSDHVNLKGTGLGNITSPGDIWGWWVEGSSLVEGHASPLAPGVYFSHWGHSSIEQPLVSCVLEDEAWVVNPRWESLSDSATWTKEGRAEPEKGRSRGTKMKGQKRRRGKL